MNKLRNYLQGAFGFLVAAAGHHYISKILDRKEELNEIVNQEERDSKANEILVKVTELHNHMKDNQVENSLNETIKSDNIPDAVKEQAVIARDLLIESKKSCIDFIHYGISNTSNTSVTTEVAKKMDEMNHECIIKVRNSISELTKLNDLFNNEKKKFLSELTGLNDYLNSLTLLEVSALYHILVCFLILITAFNILSVFFSNEIIKFFNLESNYPKLAKFFQLRRLFQKYYLLWNISILFITCIATIFIDMLVFY